MRPFVFNSADFGALAQVKVIGESALDVVPKTAAIYSHSIVAGGLEVQSSTTRLIWRHSFVMRVEIAASTS